MRCNCCSETTEESSDESTPSINGGQAVLSRPLPDAVGRELGHIYGTGRVETYGNWIETMTAVMDRELTVDDMCHVDDARHEVTVSGETDEYICVVDPLAVPFIQDEPAVVRSDVPGSDETVTAWIEGDGTLTVDPETAVVSFGAASAAGVDVEDPVERGYVALCAYGHAFPDRASYNRWAEETAAVTTSLPYADAMAFAAAVADWLV